MKPKNKARQLVKIVKEIALEQDIYLQSISHDWILKLTKNGVAKHIFGYNFELNSATAKEIADDKSATADLLTLTDVPVVGYRLFLNPTLHSYIDKQGNWRQIMDYANEVGYPLVCKTAKGTGGNNVFKVSNPVLLEDTVHKLFAEHRAICLSPFYQIQNEYRVIVLAGEAMLVYSKQIPRLIGDGESTVLQLLAQRLGNAPLSQSIIDFLAASKISSNDILPKNKSLPLNWKHNLGKGAKPVLVNDELLRTNLSDLALRAAHAINITFASVDLIETTDGQLQVLEINAGIMTESFVANLPEQYPLIKSIYEKAILKMFE